MLSRTKERDPMGSGLLLGGSGFGTPLAPLQPRDDLSVHTMRRLIRRNALPTKITNGDVSIAERLPCRDLRGD